MQNHSAPNEHEFIQIYKEHQTAVYFLALSILKDRGLAEDVMQTTFIRVRSHLAKVIERNNIHTWIMRITRNLAYNCLRDRRFELAVGERDGIADASSGVSLEDQVTDSYMLNQAFALLKQDERELFTLHVLGNYTHREISKIMGLPQGTIRWRYSQIKHKLRKWLRDYNQEGARTDETQNFL